LNTAMEVWNDNNKQTMTMWNTTLDLSEKREKRLTKLIWALVVANIFLATGQLLNFIGIV